MTEAIIDSLSGIPVGWRVFFISMLPVTELRGAIPLGALWGLPANETFLWAIAGNFAPIIPLLVLLRWLYNHMLQLGFLRRPLTWLAERSRRGEAQVDRYGWIGLMLFVAVPLPGTGVWTGCILATLLNLRLWPCVAAISLGEVIAGIAVSLVTYSVVAMSNLLYGEYIVIGIIVLAAAVYLWRKRRKQG